ncbi:MAG: RidA family protein [Bacteroidota bacterium]
MEFVHNDKAPKAIGPYSQAIVAGDLVFCAGQTPVNPETMKMEAIGIEAQTRQALVNVSHVLSAVGLTLADVVKTTVFLKNLTDFPLMNGVYAESFNGHRPARSTVEVSRLPMDALVEIECIATLKK